MINEILPVIIIFLIDIEFMYILYKSKGGVMHEMYKENSMQGHIVSVLLISFILIMFFANIAIIYEFIAI